MATISGVVDFYVVDEYIVDQSDYLLGPFRMTISASVSGSDVVTPRIVFGGSTNWDQPSSWANWPTNTWFPGITPIPLEFSASATGTRRHPGVATVQLTFSASATGKLIHGGVATPSMTFSAGVDATYRGGGVATPSLTFSMDLLTAVVHPPFPHTTFSVGSETRVYLLPLDPDNRIFAIVDGETREYPVGFESRTRTIESETRNRPVEVY